MVEKFTLNFRQTCEVTFRHIISQSGATVTKACVAVCNFIASELEDQLQLEVLSFWTGLIWQDKTSKQLPIVKHSLGIISNGNLQIGIPHC